MRKIFFLLLLPAATHAQINWKNYSTSFQGNGKEGSQPTLVTAIPYNGIYGGASYESICPSQLSLADSLGKQVHHWPAYIGVSSTIDSGEVHFLAPGLHPANADRYEYRVLLDGHTTIVPWRTVINFTKPGFALNEFAGNFGFLGGFKTTWGHSILVDLRKKSSGNILSSALVHWTSAGARLDGFLDIQMPVTNGFQLLQQLPAPSFEVIFVTAHDQYGIQAVKFAAVDYLLKPIDTNELRAAVQKSALRLAAKNKNMQLDNLLQLLHQQHHKEEHRIGQQLLLFIFG